MPSPAVALRWLADQPTVVVPDRQRAVGGAAGGAAPVQDLVLTEEQRQLLTEASA